VSTCATIRLIVREHNHLTTDMSDVLGKLWTVRLVPFVASGYLGGGASPVLGYSLAIGFACLIKLLERRVLRRRPCLEETKGITFATSDECPGSSRLSCYGEPEELSALQTLRSDSFEPVVITAYPVSGLIVEWSGIALAMGVLALSTRYFVFSPFVAISLACGASLLVPWLCSVL